ncbi:MAG: GNAT family N-acetyltransferase [Candidatus Binataceae bacterium]
MHSNVVSRRKRSRDELFVEQAREFTELRGFLNHHGMNEERDAAGCWLIAWWDGEPVGVVAIETVIDAAAMRALTVAESKRRHGVGAALVAAARDAAHARGARRLYALAAPTAADYLRRFGFTEVARAELAEALADTKVGARWQKSPANFAAHTALCLDLAHYREIIR